MRGPLLSAGVAVYLMPKYSVTTGVSRARISTLASSSSRFWARLVAASGKRGLGEERLDVGGDLGL